MPPACPSPLGCLPAAAPPASARPLRGQGVTADRAHGADHALRRWLQEHRVGYVLAVTKAQRLGLSALRRRRGTRLGEGPADPPQPRQAPRARLLPHPRHRRHGARRPRPGRRHTLGDRGRLPTPDRPPAGRGPRLRGGQGRGRPRSVRGSLLDRLAPPRHAGHARPHLPRRAAQGRPRGTSQGPTWRPSCCRSPSRKCAACSGASSGRPCPKLPPCSPGLGGDAATSNAPAAATGSAGH